MSLNNQLTDQNSRITLNPLQYLFHFSFALLPLIFPSLELYYRINNIEKVNSFPLIVHVVAIGLSLIIFYLKWREIKIDRIYESRTDEEFKLSVLATANKLKWDINELQKYKVIATATDSWSRYSQKITINRTKHYVEISSLMDPYFLSVPVFFGVNKNTKTIFFDFYIRSKTEKDINDKVIQDLKDEEYRIENEPEWNLKNSLKRIIAYVFCSVFIFISAITLLLEELTFLEIIIGSISGLVGISYIIFDIYVIIKKRDRN